MAKFEMSGDGERRLKKLATEAMNNVVDRTFKATSGKSEEIVRTQLRAEAKKAGLELKDVAVRTIAKDIAAGRRPQ